MALIDTIIGNSIHYLNRSYFTLYSALYGFGNIFTNWLWLTALYLMFCSLSYFAVFSYQQSWGNSFAFDWG